ncbi:sugar transferase [Undibacterium squillarum]|uniref:Multidrug MFS transporter n=1 Tax=Undibacterium squillarum TaxID=1131567 RepID=A0ABQ2XVR9_9BURK|nr:exopolysaccharide biosynthesis polyprenyl glycosylphosphotransferase [Undibacterium squillarum]GGX36573.1 multidrug MFS transporter [Undibacterium squillarum]
MKSHFEQFINVANSPGLRTSRLRRVRFQTFCWNLRPQLSALIKRSMDICGSLCGLILLSPLFLITAAAIAVNSKGPVLFWQDRVGRHGRSFRFPKFRSMRIHSAAERSALESKNQHQNHLTFKLRNDPRITPVGRWIRKTSIDELPQLWCVLKGDMSLVGPRPPLVSEVDRYCTHDRSRLNIRPGLTCLWQISGRSDLAFEQQLLLDQQYIDNQSLWLDLKILFLTVPAVISGKGAY